MKRQPQRAGIQKEKPDDKYLKKAPAGRSRLTSHYEYKGTIGVHQGCVNFDALNPRATELPHFPLLKSINYHARFSKSRYFYRA